MKLLLLTLSLCIASAVFGQTLNLPKRAANAPTGSEFIKRIESLNLTNREQEIFLEIMAGNVPDFLRALAPVSVTNVVGGKAVLAMFYTTPDYLAVGSDEDYFLTPMTPMTAQRIADRLNCMLPTRKMVDDICAAAAVRLAPAPMTPGATMVTVPVFAQHSAIVRTQRMNQSASRPLGALVAGNKKDVVTTTRLTNSPGKVAIYGWHRTNGVAIQPLYLGHTAAWVDYSHGIRLVHQPMTVDGKPTTVSEILADPNLAGLLSDEGVITQPRYSTNAAPVVSNPKPQGHRHGDHEEISFQDFQPGTGYGEMIRRMEFEPGVKIHINTPPFDSFATNKPVLLIFYALPNGNTTGQTIGKKLQPGDDWHFDIQHIGAQTRMLRRLMPDRTIVIAYLEADRKSWPDWRKRNGDQKIPALFDSVKKVFTGFPVQIVLTGHSGGGSLIFGYVNAVEKIPTDVTRIAFLDSNYAYSVTNHQIKLANWLKASEQHKLCVLAYHDSIALLDGKTFVSEQGGTWGRSHAMLNDFSQQFQFTARTNAGLRTHSALNGRLQLLMLENPDKKILHTVQVERNGFIHAMVLGTPDEGRGYKYLGERAYSRFIPAD